MEIEMSASVQIEEGARADESFSVLKRELTGNETKSEEFRIEPGVLKCSLSDQDLSGLIIEELDRGSMSGAEQAKDEDEEPHSAPEQVEDPIVPLREMIGMYDKWIARAKQIHEIGVTYGVEEFFSLRCIEAGVSLIRYRPYRDTYDDDIAVSKDEYSINPLLLLVDDQVFEDWVRNRDESKRLLKLEQIRREQEAKELQERLLYKKLHAKYGE